jgi:uncharacterized protein
VYWPWWLGALALSAIAVGFRWLTGKPFAVSGSIARTVEWRAERAIAQAEQHMPTDAEELARAMAAATEEEFGAAAAAEVGPAPAIEIVPRPRWSAHVTFLVMIAVGALIAMFAHGKPTAAADLGPEFARLFGGGWRMAAVLLFGGLCVGAGTRMAGGCTSGHGLSGCGRLQPGSLAATAAFFGTAIGVSLLLERIQ